MTIAGVVLAAGAGSRFEGPNHKLLADFRGQPVVVHAIKAALGAGFNQLYVVTGAVELEQELQRWFDPEPDSECDAGFESGDDAGPITWVESPDWELGQAHSLQSALAAIRADGHVSFVVGLGDQPMVPTSAWRSVGASRGPITVAEFGGQRRPPVKLEQEVWGLLPREGDLGARELIRSHPEMVSAVPCAGNAADIDTERDLKRWS